MTVPAVPPGPPAEDHMNSWPLLLHQHPLLHASSGAAPLHHLGSHSNPCQHPSYFQISCNVTHTCIQHPPLMKSKSKELKLLLLILQTSKCNITRLCNPDSIYKTYCLAHSHIKYSNMTFINYLTFLALHWEKGLIVMNTLIITAHSILGLIIHAFSILQTYLLFLAPISARLWCLDPISCRLLLTLEVHKMNNKLYYDH